MRTILAIFARDVRRIVKSPVALVVTCGVALIPSLYAWCNILANWDPYANTGNIQVAVANEDLGTDSTLVGHLDAGAQTVRKLRTNHQLGWRFVSKSDALNGVKSGEYYAAIVLPDDFSATLIGSVTGTTKRPHITYYVNEKENAIAPKITDTGATEIDEQINSTFVTAVADAVATEVKRSAQATTQSLDGAQSDVIADLNTTIDQLNSVRDELTHMSTSLSDAETTIAKAQDTNKQISADLATATGTANTTIGLLADAQTASQRFSTTLAKALDNGSVQLSSLHIGVNTATGQIVSGLNTTQSAVNAVSQAMQKTCDKTDEFIDGLDRVLASSGLDHNSKEYQALAQQIAEGRDRLDKELARLGKTAVKLDDLAKRLGFGTVDELCVAFAKEEITLTALAQAVQPPKPAPAPAPEHDLVLRGASSAASKGKVLVVGMDSLLTQLARCCHPVPPDEIVGYVTRGRGVMIHRADCPNLKNMVDQDHDRLIEVSWGRAGDDALYPADVLVIASDRSGIMKDVTEVMQREKVHVTALNTQILKGDQHMRFSLEVKGGNAMQVLLKGLRAVHGVLSARRL